MSRGAIEISWVEVFKSLASESGSTSASASDPPEGSVSALVSIALWMPSNRASFTIWIPADVDERSLEVSVRTRAEAMSEVTLQWL